MNLPDPQGQTDQTEQPKYHWHRQTIAETFERIVETPTYPWVAIGDFLEDWRRSVLSDRLELVSVGISDSELADNNLELRRWAAFCAAMVEWLCWTEGIPFPAWTSKAIYRLDQPWFLYPGDPLRAWQLIATPTPFKMRNIFGGDHMLDRV